MSLSSNSDGYWLLVDRARWFVVGCADLAAGLTAATAGGQQRDTAINPYPVPLDDLAEPERPGYAHDRAVETLNSRPCVYVLIPDAAVKEQVQELACSAGLVFQSLSGVEDCFRALRPDTRGCIVVEGGHNGADPAELLRALAPHSLYVPVVVLAEDHSIATAVAAMKAGAFDVVPKSQILQQLLRSILAAIAEQRSRRERQQTLDEVRQRYEQLTPREREVFHLVAAGCRSRVIADRLGINEKTVEVYRSRVNHKMNTRNAAELAHLSHRMNC